MMADYVGMLSCCSYHAGLTHYSLLYVLTFYNFDSHWPFAGYPRNMDISDINACTGSSSSFSCGRQYRVQVSTYAAVRGKAPENPVDELERASEEPSVAFDRQID
jgi:hypothetical protein